MTRERLHESRFGVAANAISPMNNFVSSLLHVIHQAFRKIKISRKVHSLHLEETLPFGERRFLAVVAWRNETLLVGVTPQSITLLDRKPKAVAVEADETVGPSA